jgi:hypothetical protein
MDASVFMIENAACLPPVKGRHYGDRKTDDGNGNGKYS